MEDPVIPMDNGLFNKSGDVTVVNAVVDKTHMVKNGSKLFFIIHTYNIQKFHILKIVIVFQYLCVFVL